MSGARSRVRSADDVAAECALVLGAVDYADQSNSTAPQRLKLPAAPPQPPAMVAGPTGRAARRIGECFHRGRGGRQARSSPRPWNVSGPNAFGATAVLPLL